MNIHICTHTHVLYKYGLTAQIYKMHVEINSYTVVEPEIQSPIAK